MPSRSVSLFGFLRACLHAWFGLNLAFGLVPERLVGWRRRMLCVDFRVFVIVLHNVFFYIFRFTVALKSVSLSLLDSFAECYCNAKSSRNKTRFTFYSISNQQSILLAHEFFVLLRLHIEMFGLEKKFRLLE